MRIAIFHLAFCAMALFAAPASAEQPPAGTYLTSCQDVRMVAGWLNATCQDRSGRWVQATTVPSWCASGNDIANEDGRLVCKSGGVGAAPSTGAFGAERPPAGSYMATCRDIRVSAGWLKATCQDSRGRWVDATTATSWCGPGRDIANNDGRLTCR